MIDYGPYTFERSEVNALTEYLRQCARKRSIVHYDDAYDVVKHWGAYHGPHDQRLWHLLGYISEAEVNEGRCALSAIVTLKNGEHANRPGHGFFELERDLGRYRVDDDTTWISEIEGLFEYWPRH